MSELSRKIPIKREEPVTFVKATGDYEKNFIKLSVVCSSFDSYSIDSKCEKSFSKI